MDYDVDNDKDSESLLSDWFYEGTVICDPISSLHFFYGIWSHSNKCRLIDAEKNQFCGSPFFFFCESSEGEKATWKSLVVHSSCQY